MQVYERWDQWHRLRCFGVSPTCQGSPAGRGVACTTLPAAFVVQELEKNGFSEQQIDEQRRRVAAQMAQLRSAAEGGPQDSIWPNKAD